MARVRRTSRGGEPEKYDGGGLVDSSARRRYSDKRTAEGQRLMAVREALISSVGGTEGMTEAQALILACMESKLITLWTISAYVDGLKSVVDETSGKLVACLANNFIPFTESLRRDIVTFYGLSRMQIKRERLPKIEDLISGNVGGDE